MFLRRLFGAFRFCTDLGRRRRRDPLQRLVEGVLIFVAAKLAGGFHEGISLLFFSGSSISGAARSPLSIREPRFVYCYVVIVNLVDDNDSWHLMRP